MPLASKLTHLLTTLGFVVKACVLCSLCSPWLGYICAGKMSLNAVKEVEVILAPTINGIRSTLENSPCKNTQV